MTAPVVGLVDYQAGNIFSIRNAVEHLGVDCETVTRPAELEDISHLLLPGVGAYSHCAARLEASGLKPAIHRWAIDEGRPILGICVGMQLLMQASLEYGRHAGLGWIEGEVTALPADPPEHRVPHVGWNEVVFETGFGEIAAGRALDFYFDHSYAVQNAPEDAVLARSRAAVPFAAAVRKGNILGIQCHPEKSQRAGQMFLAGFLAMGGPGG